MRLGSASVPRGTSPAESVLPFGARSRTGNPTGVRGPSLADRDLQREADAALKRAETGARAEKKRLEEEIREAFVKEMLSPIPIRKEETVSKFGREEDDLQSLQDRLRAEFARHAGEKHGG